MNFTLLSSMNRCVSIPFFSLSFSTACSFSLKQTDTLICYDMMWYDISRWKQKNNNQKLLLFFFASLIFSFKWKMQNDCVREKDRKQNAEMAASNGNTNYYNRIKQHTSLHTDIDDAGWVVVLVSAAATAMLCHMRSVFLSHSHRPSYALVVEVNLRINEYPI